MDSETPARGQAGSAADRGATPSEPHFDPSQHPFAERPHRTLVALSLPVVVSLIAEPLTGVVDTAFVARLGAAPEAALGAATALISSLLWAFNFLGIGTQTEVAAAVGRGDPEPGRRLASLALRVGAGLGVLLCALIWPLADAAAALMGTSGAVADDAALYLRIRLLGAPAVLATIGAVGALRGVQAMRATLWIALATNLVNLGLDPLLIFGLGPFPVLGLAGAAIASTIAQWLGAGFAVFVLWRRLGLSRDLRWSDASRLFVIGRDLFVRTAMLVFFTTLLTTRAANQIGVVAGAAHIAIRQVWSLAAFMLDAYAHAAQSLVGTFVAAQRVDLARRAAAVSSVWSFGTGIAIALVMVACTGWVEELLVPPEARAAFALPWLISAAAQPLNAFAFSTDGIHWGTGDYRYLRNAMLVSSGIGTALLFWAEWLDRLSLEFVWGAATVWIAARALFGVVRIWPGWGDAPLARKGGAR